MLTAEGSQYDQGGGQDEARGKQDRVASRAKNFFLSSDITKHIL